MGSIAVEMNGISRRFGSVHALNSVDFSAPTGTVSALVGENGAGKTTLMRILYGADHPDSGSIKLHGRQVLFRNAADGIRHGIGMVSQHYAIIPELNCLENLMLGAEPGWKLPLTEARSRAEALAKKMGFAFSWTSLASDLSPAGAQKLEILKLLWRNAEVMILDEPTAMLSPADSDALFAALQALAKDGATVIVVTHRLPEVLDHCQFVTVLRGGEFIESGPVAGRTASDLATSIVGSAVSLQPRVASKPKSTLLLEVTGLCAKGYRGDEALKSVDLQLRQGEILGIAGVDGSGQRELFQCLVGIRSATKGVVRMNGADWMVASTADRIANGLRLIPEDRHDEGVVDPWPLTENALIGLQRRLEFSSNGWLRTDELERLTLSMVARFATKCSGIAAPMASLSGGNQQRFVAARALEVGPKLILAFQPTRGLDIKATQKVYEGLAEECANGAAAIVVSFDLDELIDNCDRIVVMNRGYLFETSPGMARNRQSIGELMVSKT